jgi:hypothetical protein
VPGLMGVPFLNAGERTGRGTVSSNAGTKSKGLHQSERFLEAANTLGGGASAEGFAELVEMIAAARPPRKVKKPKKPKKAKRPKLIGLRWGSR